MIKPFCFKNEVNSFHIRLQNTIYTAITDKKQHCTIFVMNSNKQICKLFTLALTVKLQNNILIANTEWMKQPCAMSSQNSLLPGVGGHQYHSNNVDNGC